MNALADDHEMGGQGRFSGGVEAGQVHFADLGQAHNGTTAPGHFGLAQRPIQTRDGVFGTVLGGWLVRGKLAGGGD